MTADHIRIALASGNILKLCGFRVGQRGTNNLFSFGSPAVSAPTHGCYNEYRGAEFHDARLS